MEFGHSDKNHNVFLRVDNGLYRTTPFYGVRSLSPVVIITVHNV